MKKSLLILAAIVSVFCLNAQEGVRPLSGNINYHYNDLHPEGPKKQIIHQSKARASMQLPFKEDFAYAPTQSYPSVLLWSDSSVYVNCGFPIAPPSIGVATFDGLNKNGYPYTPNLTNMTMSLPADFLTSQPINLLVSNSATLQPTDSVAISFYYQARGRGDNPEQSDSLILDFYKPNQGKWVSRLWHVRGNSSANTSDTIFKRGFVWISDTAFLQDNFRFRFRNKATTAGDFDHWNLDYIYLNKNRSMLADTSYNDVAFGYVPTPFLSQYSAMPWKQYTDLDIATRNSVFIRNNNLNVASVNTEYESRMFNDFTGVLTYTYDGGATNLTPFKHKGWDSLSSHRKPAFTHTFSPFADSVDFRIKHFLYTGSTSDFFPDNDTVIQYQRFKNYYAFDDGSAEGGYYVLGIGGRMAQKIQVNVGDTLRALRIYFDPVGNYNTTYKFRIQVWNDAGGFPGSLIHVDSAATNIVKHYTATPRPNSPEYTFEHPKFLSPGIYYIGFQQFVATGITVGLDKNINHSDRLWFDSGNGWVQSTIYGSVMMRPVFGEKILPPVGINEVKISKTNYFISYPNPANEAINIELKSNNSGSYFITNSIGQLIKSGNLEDGITSVHTADINNGVYFLTVKLNDQASQSSKIIIQH